MMFFIRVPASSANLGPGFDSIGLAVNRYLHLEVEVADKWQFHSTSPGLENIGDDNLITDVVHFVEVKYGFSVPPCRVKMESDIPLARGLGSSAAATVAGIDLALYFYDQPVSKQEKARLASVWEGHPDNVSASVYGGLVIGTHAETETHVLSVGAPDVELVCLVPGEELKTRQARSVLPDVLAYKHAVRASSVANVLTAAILQGNWELAGEMMMRDEFHQPHRAALVPMLSDVFQFVEGDQDAYGAALSGAGPAILCFARKGSGARLARRLKKAFAVETVDVLKPASVGSAVTVAQGIGKT
ncbi:homoserine kinase [Shouchella shacheensis]|uniref:homoserine kinase n=1 Tax=Shouchella shacheensis TaxID=1649580 RepID=UPI00073FB776|nr:homoserine kinase [Shouchella shacheensis]